MLLNTPALTSPILLISAEGVRGGLMRRSERVVVWERRRVTVAFMTSSGLGRSADVVVDDEDVGAGVDVDVDVDIC
jgi:hypothetical protein